MSDGRNGTDTPADAAGPLPGGMDQATFDMLAAEYHGGTVLAAALSSYCVSAIFLIMRFITRIFIVKSVIASDWVILVAWIFTGGMTAGFIVEANYGLGNHILTVPFSDASVFAKAYYATNLCYIVALVSVKVSILLLFLRILNAARVHRICYVVLGFILFFGLYSLITNIFICYPIEKFWDPLNHPEGWCFPVGKFWSDVACHLAGEFMLLFLPMPFIYTLKMPRKQKAAVVFLFALGIFLIIISFTRIPSLKKAQDSTDPTWEGVDGVVWSCVELNVAIICACCMTLRPLASKIFPNLISSWYIPPSDGSGEKRNNGAHPLTVGSEQRKSRNQRDALDTIDDGLEVHKESCSNMSRSTGGITHPSRSPTTTDDDLEKGVIKD